MFSLSGPINARIYTTKTKHTMGAAKFKGVLTGIVVSLVISGSAFADGGSVHHSGQASKHSVLSVGHAVGSGAKIASAIIAAPILASGAVSLAVGSSALASGTAIMDSGQTVTSRLSTHDYNTPLVVTDIVITADPAPNQVKKAGQVQDKKVTQITTTSTSETTIVEDEK